MADRPVDLGSSDPRRPDLRAAIERDFRKEARRERGHGSFWRSLSVIGSVGWPIALLTAAGALLGHWIDLRYGSGIRWALVLITCGATLGCWTAWRLLGKDRK